MAGKKSHGQHGAKASGAAKKTARGNRGSRESKGNKPRGGARGGGRGAARNGTRGLPPAGAGGEPHQASEADLTLTTNQGVPVSDDQNSLRAGARGPGLLEDFILREKITHFDHERIPERIVHAHGSGAHGTFRPYRSWKHLTAAAFLSDPGTETRTFVRFSTVAGSKGSRDTARDVRGWATKFYTTEGNYDLVGNNMPVFFIQDAMKFPDLIHAVKPEPDRGFPQAQSAHDTFWDFVSLMPESVHMLLWVMSDRALPRSFRMMEGFGVHTFRLVNARGEASFAKFHWRPLIGSSSLLWDEAVKIGGADPDYNRRDLWMAIDSGDFPEYELGVQSFTAKQADGFDFDVLDPTKLLPEELVPVTMLGRMTLNRNPVNVFAETEQVAFCPSHLVPGIEFTDDPLLQGRLFSYLDTQLGRIGGPNFHQIPINAPLTPPANMQRDGKHQMEVPASRVAYEPSLLDAAGPRENARTGFRSVPDADVGPKLRLRPESFADHYTQARLFFRSQTPPEQHHIVQAFAFELGKVQTEDIRRRMLGHLDLVDAALGADVADLLGMAGKALAVRPAVPPRDMRASPALSLVAKGPDTLQGRKLGILVTDGVERALLDALVAAMKKEGGTVQVIAPRIGGVRDDRGGLVPADDFLRGSPSVLFDVVALLVAADAVPGLLLEPASMAFVHDAWAHLKFIGFSAGAGALLQAAGVPAKGDGLMPLEKRPSAAAFLADARRLRVWSREPGSEPMPSAESSKSGGAKRSGKRAR